MGVSDRGRPVIVGQTGGFRRTGCPGAPGAGRTGGTLMKRRIALILPLLLLGACARLPPHLPGGKMAQDTQISGTLAYVDGHNGVLTGTWPVSNWWTSAQLPALNTLISEALRDNNDLTF